MRQVESRPCHCRYLPPTSPQMITDSDGASDLPLFLTAPLYRRWHLRWGSTTGEVVAAMPGDALLPTAQFVSTRSITIDATPGCGVAVVGTGRLRPRRLLQQRPSRRPSATTIVADLQHLEVDQWVPMSASSADGDPRGLAHGVRRLRDDAANGAPDQDTSPHRHHAVTSANPSNASTR